jgi:predicted transcriptional regulator
MAKNEVVTVRLKPDVREKLDALARDTNRSASHLASEAIEAYVNLHAWQVEHIKAALTEDEAGGPAVPHEEVVQWVQSWGKDRELPRPQPKKS